MENQALAQLQEKLHKLDADYNIERSSLVKQISEIKDQEKAGALAKIRSLMNEYDIDPTSIGGGANKKTRKPHAKSGPVEAKYRGPNGETWSGRGRQPRWMTDDREKFLIKD